MADFQVERDILIRAERATVWRFFEDGERFARWWGPGSDLELREGGAVRIVYPNGDTASGQVRSFTAPERIAFTFGYDDASKPIPPGGSLVTITLEERPDGTRVRLRHDVDDATTRDQHDAGWRFQLSVFSKVACDDQHASVASRVEDWFAAWNHPEEAERREAMTRCATQDIAFADAYGVTRGIEDLLQHILIARMHMPVSLEMGTVTHAQGSAVVDWEMKGPDASVLARGVNLVDLAPDGRIARVVGLPRP